MNEFCYDFKLLQMIGTGENIVWQGKPDKKCFILESIFNHFMIVAIVWFLVDCSFIAMMFSSQTIIFNGQETPTRDLLGFMVPFFALHLMPVWIYLGGVIFIWKKHKNTEYVITDNAIYISGGIFNYKYKRKTLEKIKYIQLRQGYFDKMLNIGDVILERYCPSQNTHSDIFAIVDIPDFRYVQEVILKLQDDIVERKNIQNSYSKSTDEENYRNHDIE